MYVSAVVALIATYYFHRAYGFAFRGWMQVPPRGAVVGCAYYGLMVALVPDALYEQYFHESLFSYFLGCLVVAGLPIAVLRAALGKARPAQ